MKKIATIYKNFEYNVLRHNQKVIRKASYRIVNLQTCGKFISNERYLIQGTYDVKYCQIRDKASAKLEFVTVPFQEIISLKNVPIEDIDHTEIKVALVDSEGIYDERQKAKEENLSSRGIFSRVGFKVRGKLCLEVYDTKYGEKKNTGYDILCIASTRWDFMRQRPHHLMERLSKENRVLFFNHSFPVSYDYITRLMANPALLEERLTKIQDNLWVFSTVHLDPAYENNLSGERSLKDFNYQVKAKMLKVLCKRLDFDDPVIITYLGESVEYLQGLPRKMLCYDCIDDFSGFSWSDKDTEMLEKKLINTSDIVFASGKELYKKIKGQHPKTFFLPNAVEYGHFSKAFQFENSPDVLASMEKPIIGFMGAFWEWIDDELLEYLALARPDWNFVIIGPVQPAKAEQLLVIENIHFLGVHEYKELPWYMSCFDVCLIPFKVYRVTECANPIKLWEYLATGKPIVSTPIPDVQQFADVIYLGRTKEEFLEKVEEALGEKDSTYRSMAALRMAIARENDWDHRVLDLLKAIQGFEGGNNHEDTFCE